MASLPLRPRTPGVLLILLALWWGERIGSQGELVIHKDGTGLYHRPGCPVIADASDVLVLSRAQAESRGYKSHPDCDPANPSVPQRGGSTGRATPASSPEIVYLGDAKYYHRKDCSRLKGVDSPKTSTLQAAAKSHWPCPACKPPIFKKSAEPAIPGTNRRRGR